MTNAPAPKRAWLERIDRDHANAAREWQEMGAPEYLEANMIEALHDSSRTTAQGWPWTLDNGTLVFEMDLIPHAVAALGVEF